MKKITIFALAVLAAGCGRNIRTAEDITPGNPKESRLSWKYGATDIRIQTSNITRELVNRWFQKTGYDISKGKPRIIVTQVDNRTDMVIPTDMIRDIVEHVGAEDGRVTIVVGDAKDEQELDRLLAKGTKDPKYSNSGRPQKNQVSAPQFLAKIRLVKAITEQKRYDIEEYRMTITLYNIETEEVIDSAFDILRKKVEI